MRPKGVGDAHQVNIPEPVTVKLQVHGKRESMPDESGRRGRTCPNSVSQIDRLEKLEALYVAARTANRHRWVGRIYQGVRVKPR